MSNDKGTSEKLGHDPLEWLTGEEEALVPEPQTTQAPAEPEPMFTLPTSLSVQHIEQIHADLLEYVQKQTQSVQINAHQVEAMDSSGYQLLVSLVKTCQGKSLKCQITDPSPALNTKLNALGDNVVIAQLDVS